MTPRHRIRLVSLSAAIVLGLCAGRASAQAPGAGDEARRPPVRVFIDSPMIPVGVIEKGLTFLAPVRSPAEAEVLVEVAPAPPGAAPAFVIKIRGAAEFAGITDTLFVRVPPGRTPAETEQDVIRSLRLGLLRFALKTSVASRLSVAFEDAVEPTAVVDPWHFWVFSLGLDAFLNGEEVYRSTMFSGSFSAQKVTPDWKIRFGASLSSSRDVYDIDDYHYDSTSESRTATALVARSLDDHWSAGGILQLGSSTYSNTRFRLAPQAAIEYDLFPYSESTRRQLRFLYAVGPTGIRYREETIYGKTRETLWSHSLSATLELKQPWGTVSTTLSGSQYFHDLSRNRITLGADLSLRIFEGFNFNIDGGGSRVHDQLFLAKGGASFEEVLLQRRQLETGFDYYFSVGLSFTFGSTRSNVVNPRFGSGSGGISMSISM
jgi:hypothetical protein